MSNKKWKMGQIFEALSKYLNFNTMNNLSSYCGLVDARISASEKDLPVIQNNVKTRLKMLSAFKTVQKLT